MNEAFIHMTGHAREAVLVKHPLMLAGDHREDVPSEEMGDAVKKTGKWQGELICTRKAGEAFPAWVCISAVRDAQGNIPHYTGIFFDLSLLKENEQRLKHMAHYDMLTNLPTRALMYDRLKQSLSLAKRHRYSVAVMILDIDRFKEVNDTHGHHIGDQLQAPERGGLQEACRPWAGLSRSVRSSQLMPDPASARPDTQ